MEVVCFHLANARLCRCTLLPQLVNMLPMLPPTPAEAARRSSAAQGGGAALCGSAHEARRLGTATEAAWKRSALDQRATGRVVELLLRNTARKPEISETRGEQALY